MSIFPKKTVPGKTVTIHWNFNTSDLKDKHIFPLVRIGVVAPDGAITMLFEDHVLALPAQQQYLRKSTPLLILANYLSGSHCSKEQLFTILENIQTGRHFYFTYQLAPDALPGKYLLLSEVHNNGQIKYSKTAPDDFFLVEKISIKNLTNGAVTMLNHSPEPVKVKLVEYYPDEKPVKTDVSFYDLAGNEEKAIRCKSSASFILYNEEREIIPLASKTFVLRNQQLLSLEKDDTTFVWNKSTDETFDLQDERKYIWDKADGITTNKKFDQNEYEAMLSQGLITEIKL
jgi:hypothetical protein